MIKSKLEFFFLGALFLFIVFCISFKDDKLIETLVSFFLLITLLVFISYYYDIIFIRKFLLTLLLVILILFLHFKNKIVYKPIPNFDSLLESFCVILAVVLLFNLVEYYYNVLKALYKQDRGVFAYLFVVFLFLYILYKEVFRR